jgi:hypothetical protein
MSKKENVKAVEYTKKIIEIILSDLKTDMDINDILEKADKNISMMLIANPDDKHEIYVAVLTINKVLINAINHAINEDKGEKDEDS